MFYSPAFSVSTTLITPFCFSDHVREPVHAGAGTHWAMQNYTCTRKQCPPAKLLTCTRTQRCLQWSWTSNRGTFNLIPDEKSFVSLLVESFRSAMTSVAPVEQSAWPGENFNHQRLAKTWFSTAISLSGSAGVSSWGLLWTVYRKSLNHRSCLWKAAQLVPEIQTAWTVLISSCGSPRRKTKMRACLVGQSGIVQMGQCKAVFTEHLVYPYKCYTHPQGNK